jgi:tRNA1(Val) A37 N6-methylase TrmN6
MSTSSKEMSRFTVDGFLGGRVEALQPRAGHRAGLEAVLLGGSIDPNATGTVVDLGAGAGVAGFCAAVRARNTKVVLVERDSEAAEAARQALARVANRAFARRAAMVEAAIADRDAILAAAGPADQVLMNPPFHQATSTSASPDGARADAHVLGEGGLEEWFSAASAILKPGGRVTIIFRADGLDILLAAIGKRFGALDILPIHPRAQAPAHRLLVSAMKDSRAGLKLLPPLVLHGTTGSAFLPEIEALLRGRVGLSEAHPPWQPGA